MGGWVVARPSIEKKMKELGFSDADIKGIHGLAKEDRAKFKAEVEKLIKKKKDKEKQIRAACNQIIPGLGL